MEDGREKREYLTRLLDNLAHARKEWIDSDDNTFSPELALAVEETIEAFGTGLVPGDCRLVERQVHAMGVEYNRAKEQAGGWETGNLPGNGFWAAIEDVIDGRQKLHTPPNNSIEPVAELTAQKVPDAQICKIYGWVDGDGRPQLWKLREERLEPGKHTRNWVNPHERRRRELLEQQKASLEAMRRKQAGKLKRLTEPDPQPIKDLIIGGVSARQIAKMKKISVEEVLIEADQLGLDRPQIDYAPLASQRSPHEPDMPEAQATAMNAWSRRGRVDGDQDVSDEGGEEDADRLDVPPGGDEDTPTGALTMEQEILLYHGQGHKPGEIATMMQAAGVSVNKVTAVIKRYANKPEEAAAAGAPAGGGE